MGRVVPRDWKPQAAFFESKETVRVVVVNTFFWCVGIFLVYKKTSVVQVVDATHCGDSFVKTASLLVVG